MRGAITILLPVVLPRQMAQCVEDTLSSTPCQILEILSLDGFGHLNIRSVVWRVPPSIDSTSDYSRSNDARER